MAIIYTASQFYSMAGHQTFYHVPQGARLSPGVNGHSSTKVSRATFTDSSGRSGPGAFSVRTPLWTQEAWFSSHGHQCQDLHWCE